MNNREWKIKNIFQSLTFPRVILDLIVLSMKITLAMIVASFKVVIPTTMKSLIGETVLITGAGRGIGRELAIQLGLMGCIVICWDVDINANRSTISAVSKNGGEVIIFSKVLETQLKISNTKKLFRSTVSLLTFRRDRKYVKR
ncbi:estradiol 17-beta-dehydrogenase 11-like [Vespula pensylvanica]|uniref:estradiol 17-beta-dehydrogenase 11-like n=1 Tax=Vespula pensylvanica TaxID=30213 RepID=UPI001CBA4CDA|nr:estradiol 17-beta-dehydrogenase 11-like [Vespula pensylvanica]